MPETTTSPTESTEEQASAADQRRRAMEAWEQLQRLRERVSARNQDLTDEQIEALAEELSQAAIARLVERGEISFERDRT